MRPLLIAALLGGTLSLSALGLLLGHQRTAAARVASLVFLLFALASLYCLYEQAGVFAARAAAALR